MLLPPRQLILTSDSLSSGLTGNDEMKDKLICMSLATSSMELKSHFSAYLPLNWSVDDDKATTPLHSAPCSSVPCAGNFEIGIGFQLLRGRGASESLLDMLCRKVHFAGYEMYEQIWEGCWQIPFYVSQVMSWKTSLNDKLWHFWTYLLFTGGFAGIAPYPDPHFSSFTSVVAMIQSQRVLQLFKSNWSVYW